MAKKPSYVGLLNAVANAERGGHRLFKTWSESTRDKKLRPVLEMVAIREMEHSWAFEKRLSELGFSLRPAVNKALSKQLKLLKSNASDVEKFASFGVGNQSAKSSAKNSAKGSAQSRETDNLLQLLADKSIDPQTGALLGRFISEERDTGRQLLKAYNALQRRQKSKAKKL